MQVAILSGKGGTGKTFISVNMASAAGEAVCIDCDVEEPNGWLFLKPVEEKTCPVEMLLPEVDIEKCSGCRICVEFCKFSALAYVKDKLMIFPQLCHSCGGCILLCPQKALAESSREIGRIIYGTAGKVATRTGVLNPGEPAGVAIINQLLEKVDSSKLVVLDCPPGSGCNVIESIRSCDYCLLVAEPTVFGVHNLALVLKLVRLFGKPCGVVINKAVPGKTIVEDFCRKEKVQVLESIPFDRNVAAAISNGELAVKERKYQQLFRGLIEKIRGEGT